MPSRLTVTQIIDRKKQGQKIVMLTAYDYPMGLLLDRCGIDMILVGDSLANVVLGLESTREVDMDIMLYHTRAVNRAVSNALLVGDMPFGSYENSESQAIKNARLFIQEGCAAVKVEWFDGCLKTAKAMVQSGIPVMAHVGLTPQTVFGPQGFKVKGREAQTAQKIIDQALDLEQQGCFAVVLECVPDRVAEIVTRKLKIPTIGIGSGPFCDGQVLVTYDLLGLSQTHRPKFVKSYASLGEAITKSVVSFREEVKQGWYPDKEHSYSIPDEELEKLQTFL